MQTNKMVTRAPVYNHHGVKAVVISAEAQLRRSVMACLLWEDQFYENGKTIADRIVELVPKVRPETVQKIAVQARMEMKLRHAPLLIVYAMTKSQRHKGLVASTLAAVIQRPDEITEYVSLYFALGGKTLSAQSKKGLARAFQKFPEHVFAKYDRDKAWKLRDVAFLSHPTAIGLSPTAESVDAAEKLRLYPGGHQKVLLRHDSVLTKIIDRTLKTAGDGTWEQRLSSGEDKKAVFLDLMATNQLGGLAFIRNLRNMMNAGVDKQSVAEYAARVDVKWILPYQFITAARHVPAWEDAIEPMMLRALDGMQKLPGKTVLLVDVSPSMNKQLSSKSEMTRKDAALGLAIVMQAMVPDLAIYPFCEFIGQVPSRRGFALGDAIKNLFPHGRWTLLGQAVYTVANQYERIIVLTDEESQDPVPAPTSNLAYMINVASTRNGVGYGPWTHFDGWSEHIARYILESETKWEDSSDSRVDEASGNQSL